MAIPAPWWSEPAVKDGVECNLRTANSRQRIRICARDVALENAVH